MQSFCFLICFVGVATHAVAAANLFSTGVITDQTLTIQVSALDERVSENLPSSWDWRKVNGQNWMTPIRSQDVCGSCVAFGAASVLEAQMKISSGLFWWQPQISTQSFFACGGGNCGQGWIMEFAADQLKTVGVPDEACAPYMAKSGAEYCQNCQDHLSRRIYTYESKKIISGTIDRDIIKRALMRGPVWALMIVYDDFYNYKFGVYKNQEGRAGPGHTIAIIGYDDAKKAWIVKNSWGEIWGSKGYGMIHYDDISGLGTIAYSLILPEDSSYVAIQGLNQGDIINQNRMLVLSSLRADVESYRLEIQNEKTKALSVLSCQGVSCQVQLDSTVYEDGNYIFRPFAKLKSNQEIQGWTISGKVQKMVPTARVLSKTERARIFPISGELKGIQEWSIRNPLRSNYLVIRILKDERIVQKREVYNLPDNYKLKWDTRSLQNGQYRVEMEYRSLADQQILSQTRNSTVISIEN